MRYKYNDKSIPLGLYQFYLMAGIPYEGFVTGYGYAYSQSKMVIQVPSGSNYELQGASLFTKTTIRMLDKSAEAKMRSLNLKAEDFAAHLITERPDGSISVNMGNGEILTLPKHGASIKTEITEHKDGLMFQISASNSALQKTYSRSCKLRDFQIVFSPRLNENRTLSMPAYTTDGIIKPEIMDISADKGSYLADMLSFMLFLAGEGNEYYEGKQFKYKHSSIIENKPKQWLGKNNKWIDSNKRPNQYTGKRVDAFKQAAKFQQIARGLFIADVIFSASDIAGGLNERDTKRIINGVFSLGVSVASIFVPAVGWAYAGYLVLNMMGAFDPRCIRFIPIREPHVLEMDNTRIISPKIEPIKIGQQSQFLGIPQRKQMEFRQGNKY